jgi:hypothetical protein
VVRSRELASTGCVAGRGMPLNADPLGGGDDIRS